MWGSLRLRLLLATFLVLVIALGVTALVASQRAAGEFENYVAHRGNLDDRRYAHYLGTYYHTANSWAGVENDVDQVGQISGQRVVIANPEGKIVGDSEHVLVGKPVDPHWPPPVEDIMVDGKIVGALFLNPVAGIDPVDVAFLAAINRSLLLGAAVAGLAAVLVTLFVSTRIVQPIEQLTKAAQRMATGDLSARVSISERTEIGRLAQAFNAMAGSLAEQEQLRRQMVGDVAHELRTPLTNLKGYLQASRDGLLAPDAALVDNLYEETTLLGRLVNDLQELAQAEAGQLALFCEPAPLPGIVEQAVQVLRPQVVDRGLTLDVALPEALPWVYADRDASARSCATC